MIRLALPVYFELQLDTIVHLCHASRAIHLTFPVRDLYKGILCLRVTPGYSSCTSTSNQSTCDVNAIVRHTWRQAQEACSSGMSICKRPVALDERACFRNVSILVVSHYVYTVWQMNADICTCTYRLSMSMTTTSVEWRRLQLRC